MSEKHLISVEIETAQLVQNEKRLKETWSECIARVFTKYAEYRKAGFVL